MAGTCAIEHTSRSGLAFVAFSWVFLCAGFSAASVGTAVSNPEFRLVTPLRLVADGAFVGNTAVSLMADEWGAARIGIPATKTEKPTQPLEPQIPTEPGSSGLTIAGITLLVPGVALTIVGLIVVGVGFHRMEQDNDYPQLVQDGASEFALGMFATIGGLVMVIPGAILVDMGIQERCDCQKHASGPLSPNPSPAKPGGVLAWKVAF